MDQNEHTRWLFSKYMKNQLSPEEISRLKEIINVSDEEELNNQLSQLWDSYAYAGKQNQKTREQIAANLKNILQINKPSVRRFFPVWNRVAVVFTGILLICTTYLYTDRNQMQKALLAEYTTVQAGNEEKATVILPDGSKVYLNSQSHITYPASFGQEEREVQFIGEGYFEIARNEQKPFIVNNPAVKIKVLGTVFNFYATSHDDWFETTLIEGKIEVTLNKLHPYTAILRPNQKISYNKQTGEWKISKTDAWEETAWKRGDLVFRSKTLREIIDRLESYYGVIINIEGSLPEKLFTGTYREDNVNSVLQNLQQHYAFTYTKTGNVIEIKLILHP
jgi:ferric-dicitrate binding protein FerR (iron transport regulator)